MFIRKKKNRSGNISVTIITKIDGIYRVVKSFGSSNTAQGVELLYQKARHHMESLSQQPTLFISQEDALIESYLSSIKNGQVQVKGPELVFGKLYDHLGFGEIKEDLFRHLVIARLSYPGSKLKTIDYLYRYLSIEITVDAVYRFLDKLQDSLKEQVEQIAFSHTKSALRNNISVVFYDMTTLHFEASDEDDLRKTGFSKNGKHQHPQIYLGLLVAAGGFTIGYDIFEGNIYEGNTLIPTIEKFERKFNLSKPIVVADAGLLSNNNVALLEKQGYSYILGARIKNEKTDIKQKIIKTTLQDGQTLVIRKNEATRLIISYTNSRAAKDEHNRKRGLQRLEKQIKSGKLTKSSINNKGYNKYLKMVGELQIEIDYQKYQQDKQWDGLKGYLTNCRLKDSEIIGHYKQLWQIEKAFRISKTDLKIRPVYHRLRHRIEAHICIAFVAYSIYKELERILQKEKSHLSLKEAADLTHTIYQLNVILPQSKHEKSIILKMDGDQDHLTELINKNI
jgi:transposase